MEGKLLKSLIETMGRKSAYKHVENILKLHKHSNLALSSSTAVPLEPWRNAEKELFERLVRYRKEWNIDVDIVNVSKATHCGDILVTTSESASIWDSKHYSGRVPMSQVRKLASDVRVQGAAFGVIVASNGISGGRSFLVCDGVPIHICAPGSPQEFSCLYLSRHTSTEQRSRTTDAARAAHVFSLVTNLQGTIDELKAALCFT